MVLVLTAMTSLILIVFGMGLIALTLRDSGAAVLSALAGETRLYKVHSTLRVRRAVRVRSQSFAQQVAMARVLRAAA
jgi:hypothetical protein